MREWWLGIINYRIVGRQWYARQWVILSSIVVNGDSIKLFYSNCLLFNERISNSTGKRMGTSSMENFIVCRICDAFNTHIRLFTQMTPQTRRTHIHTHANTNPRVCRRSSIGRWQLPLISLLSVTTRFVKAPRSFLISFDMMFVHRSHNTLTHEEVEKVCCWFWCCCYFEKLRS